MIEPLTQNEIDGADDVAAASARSTQVGGDHYASKKIQPWDAMHEWMTAEQFEGYLRGNVLKYMARYADKDGLKDVRKAGHYLERLIEHLEGRK